MSGLREKYQEASPDPKFQGQLAGGKPNPAYGAAGYDVLHGRYNQPANRIKPGIPVAKGPSFWKIIEDTWNYLFGKKQAEAERDTGPLPPPKPGGPIDAAGNRLLEEQARLEALARRR